MPKKIRDKVDKTQAIKKLDKIFSTDSIDTDDDEEDDGVEGFDNFSVNPEDSAETSAYQEKMMKDEGKEQGDQPQSTVTEAEAADVVVSENNANVSSEASVELLAATSAESNGVESPKPVAVAQPATATMDAAPQERIEPSSPSAEQV
jgi:hypothetical protein